MSSSHQIDQAGDTKKFTVTAFLSFVTVFVFLMLMSQCHGDFKPATPATETAAPSSAK